MGRYLRENWLWILAPILIVLALFIALVVARADHTTPEFVYTIS